METQGDFIVILTDWFYFSYLSLSGTLSHIEFFSAGTVALELQHTRVSAMNSNELSRQGSKRNQISFPKGLNIASLQKRPSIAPVPAVLEANDIDIRLGASDSESNDAEDVIYANEDREAPE